MKTVDTNKDMRQKALRDLESISKDECEITQEEFRCVDAEILELVFRE